MRENLVQERLPDGKVRVVRQRQAQPVLALNERRRAVAGGLQPTVTGTGRVAGGCHHGRGRARAAHGSVLMGCRQAGNVLRHPQPQPFQFDRLPFVHDIVIDTGRADLGKKGPQRRVPGAGRRQGGSGSRRRARDTHALIGPGLFRDPLQGVVPVGGIVGIDAVFSLRGVAAARILIHGRIAVGDDGLPAAQDGAVQRGGRTGHPAPGRVAHRLARWGRDAVGRAVHDDGKARSPVGRQKHKGVESDPVAHGHIGLKPARTALFVNDLHD